MGPSLHAPVPAEHPPAEEVNGTTAAKRHLLAGTDRSLHSFVWNSRWVVELPNTGALLANRSGVSHASTH